MNVAVLLAGIADPKWPLGAAQPRILSPFDESALEVALKLRDDNPAVQVAMLVAGSDEAMLRTVASHRPDELRRIDVPAAFEWDARAQAGLWKDIILQLALKPELVLIGREFGDRDDGTLAACIGEALSWRFMGLAQGIRATGPGLEAMRERGSMEEKVQLAAPMVASITNDRRNKLRHPLMKNVMAAKRMALEALAPATASAPAVTLEALSPTPAVTRAASCRMLEGPLADRVEALAAFLQEWKSSP